MVRYLTNILVLSLSPFFILGQQIETKVLDTSYVQKFIQDYNQYAFFKPTDYKVVAGDSLLNIDLQNIVIQNPYDTGYPICYSTIFDDNLIALFKPGNFVCYDLETFLRNPVLEKGLNTKKFKHQWIINGKLIALSQGKLWEWSEKKWLPSKIRIPTKKKPILYKDNQYLVYKDCHGEWGGTVYFYHKMDRNIYYTRTTCANTVIRKQNGYQILSCLGHMDGSTDLKLITDPKRLPMLSARRIKEQKRLPAIGYSDKSEEKDTIFDVNGLLFLSTFKFGINTVYFCHIFEKTFLATLDNKNIKLVHSFYESDIYAFNPITRFYGKYQMMNLDFYVWEGDDELIKEVACIFVNNNRILKVEWNQNHYR